MANGVKPKKNILDRQVKEQILKNEITQLKMKVTAQSRELEKLREELGTIVREKAKKYEGRFGI